VAETDWQAPELDLGDGRILMFDADPVPPEYNKAVAVS
jgi:hypothetical protein